MNTRLARVVLYCTALVVVSTTTFWFGFRQGAEVGAMIEAVPRGGISLFHLTKIEAAAWPLAAIAGPSFLRELFVAYQLGFDEGHDNGGFSTALIELATLFPEEARQALSCLAASADEPVRGHAQWLITFCKAPGRDL
jgi:hypothetical protein